MRRFLAAYNNFGTRSVRNVRCGELAEKNSPSKEGHNVTRDHESKLERTLRASDLSCSPARRKIALMRRQRLKAHDSGRAT